MAEWENRLDAFFKLLSQVPRDPVFEVTATTGSKTTDPNGPLAIEAKLRTQYKRGELRISNADQLRVQFAELGMFKHKATKEWDRLVASLPKVALSTRQKKERSFTHLLLTIGGKTYRSARSKAGKRFNVGIGAPTVLLQKHIAAGLPHRYAIVSLVISQNGLHQKELESYKTSIKPAFVLLSKMTRNKASIHFKEVAASIDTARGSFETKASNVCARMRVEVRVLNEGTVPKRAWSLRQTKGGSR